MGKDKMSSAPRPFVLLILDGWGLSRNQKGNAVRQARIPYFNHLWAAYPHAILSASGLAVGLPKGQVGNSEAGHTNIGAGRIVKQDSVVVNDSIANGTFFKNSAFLQVIRHVKIKKSRLHLFGLLTGAQSAHADQRHLYAFLDFVKKEGLRQVYLHLFTDGRDAPPISALEYLRNLEARMIRIGIGKIVSIAGRYYAMDRIRDWERVEMVYDNLTLGLGEKASNVLQAAQNYYSQGITDEFIPPTLITDSPPVLIEDDDGVIFFNLRTDRAKQITEAFIKEGFRGFKRKKVLKGLCFVTMTEFGPGLEEALIAYPGRLFYKTLPNVVGQNSNYHQLYIAESEKFPHVTYFLNGGFPKSVDREERVRIPSLRVKSYVEQPEMKAREVTDKVLASLRGMLANFVVLNYANPDMLGHTGNLKAAIFALEFLDRELLRLASMVKKMKGTMLITADHGNVEEMIDPKTGSILTSHTSNPVPLILADFGRSRKMRLKKRGKLANIAPTILDYLGFPKPKEMTEESLIIHNKTR